MSPSKLYIITAALSCQGGSQNWQNCPRTNAQLTKDFPPKKLNIDHQIKHSCYSENHEILVYESNRLFSKLPIIKNIMKIYVLEDQADTLRQKQMTTSTHWARWWRWWACCRWTWCGSRSSPAASPTSCRGRAPCTTGGVRGPLDRGRGPWFLSRASSCHLAWKGNSEKM